MDNIRIQKIYQDADLVELKISAEADFINAFQYCYTSIEDLEMFSKTISEYARDCSHESYIEFGSKKGNYSPACSFRFLKPDKFGHVKIEVDLEIDDNEERLHRCVFYVESVLGAVQDFSIAVSCLNNANNDFIVELN